MESFRIDTDPIPITDQEGILSLESYGTVIGVSMEITDESQDSAMDFGLGTQPIMRINQGDNARQFGGFNVCGIPCHYGGNVQWKFTTNNGPKALLIITRLTTASKEVK